MKQTQITDFAREVLRSGHFTPALLATREKYVGTLRDFYKMGIEVWDALAVIKEQKLYWPHETVKEFCRIECGWSDSRFYQIVNASKIRAALPEKTQPNITNEKQIRELSKHPQEQRAEIVDDAVRFHAKNGKISARAIREAADQIGKAIDKDGTMIPEGDASYHWRHRNEGEQVLEKIHAAGMAVKALSEDDVMYLECDLQSTIKALRAAYHTFKGGLPAYVCPKCEGKKPSECILCHGRGMIGTWKRKQKAGGKEFLEELQIRTFA